MIKGEVNNTENFETYANIRTIPAENTDVMGLNYNVNKNNLLDSLAGYPDHLQKNYTSHKVLIDKLDPNTTYSYRVGKEGAWSAIGTFITAKENKDTYDFIYITDTQAQDDEMFDVSPRTVKAACKIVPNAKFLLINGDLVETYRDNHSEWEWEQWFEKMQDIWLMIPIVPVQGNHDASLTNNMFYHFNTDRSYNLAQTNENTKTYMDGTVYSFVYGDALFLILNYEGYKKGEPY